MKSSWETQKLSDICQIGSAKRIYLKDYVSIGIPFYRSKEIILKQKGEEISDILYISVSKFDEINLIYGSPKFNDILITSVGTIGVPYIVKKDEKFYFKDGNLTWIRNYDSKVIPKFLYYWILSPTGQNNIDEISIGSTQKAITIKSLNEVKIDLPSKNEQESIAKILSSIDDKIKLNNKINYKLETLSQTLYKHWFVDFEFPNEKGEPYKSSGGEMVDSELGLIPKGWEVKILENIFTFERGVEPGSKNYKLEADNHTVPFFRVGDLDTKTNVFVNKDLVKSKFVNEKDVLVSFDGAVGRIGIGFVGAYSSGLRKVLSKDNLINNSVIYFIMKSNLIQETMAAHANGTTILHASSSIPFLKMQYNFNVVKKFDHLISPIFQKLIQHKKESIRLAALRDLLLPKLMSGEIEVPVEE